MANPNHTLLVHVGYISQFNIPIIMSTYSIPIFPSIGWFYTPIDLGIKFHLKFLSAFHDLSFSNNENYCTSNKSKKNPSISLAKPPFLLVFVGFLPPESGCFTHLRLWPQEGRSRPSLGGHRDASPRGQDHARSSGRWAPELRDYGYIQ